MEFCISLIIKLFLNHFLSMTKSIAHIIDPKPKDLGDNFMVRRALPVIEKRMVGPFVFWDHMGPVTIAGKKEMKVRAHPHIGLATITYLFSGSILHRDNLNNEQYIRPGEVNWMTAGSGIAHSERANSVEPMDLEGIQLWVALPKEKEEVAASFVHFKETDLPMITTGGTSLRLIAGSALGENSPVPVYSDLFYLNGQSEKGQRVEFPVSLGQEAALYMIRGRVKIDNEVFERFQLIIFKEQTPINIEVLEDSEYMIFGGEIFPEGRHMWWNFVSSSKERIEQAKSDWAQGRFLPVINEDETIPLPKI